MQSTTAPALPPVTIPPAVRSMELLFDTRLPASSMSLPASSMSLPASGVGLPASGSGAGVIATAMPAQTGRASPVGITSQQAANGRNVLTRWRQLAEHRLQALAALYDSGRWRLYYGEARFREVMREAVDNVDAWRKLAPPDDALLDDAPGVLASNPSAIWEIDARAGAAARPSAIVTIPPLVG